MWKTIYLTQEWLNNLQEELRSLKEERRVEIAEKLKEAIEVDKLNWRTWYKSGWAFVKN